ncbi:NAD(P)/FAD-dependent oxidoreductase [Paenibacillus sp. strain BS8-2]
MSIDVAIIGGGPAGLNAALVLGRSRKNVMVIDNDKPRNGVTHASHGFITRDGITPAEFRRIGIEEVLKYPTVQHLNGEVSGIANNGNGFDVKIAAGDTINARRVILAAGFREVLPSIEGIKEMYGKSLFVCPFCDGWELRDQPLVVISDQPAVFHSAKLMLNWSRDLLVCTNGGDPLTAEQRRILESRGVVIVDSPVIRLAGADGKLENVHLADGSSLARSGGFVAPTMLPNAVFGDTLGYKLEANGGIETDAFGRTSIAGLYAAGDSAYAMPSQLIYAAASGSKAAMAVMADILEEEWGNI